MSLAKLYAENYTGMWGSFFFLNRDVLVLNFPERNEVLFYYFEKAFVLYWNTSLYKSYLG